MIRRAPMTISRPWRSARPRLKDGIEAVSIVTPNHMHYAAAKEFLQARHPCHLRQAADLQPGAMPRSCCKIAEESGALFILTHNYTGYPMVRQAREMVASGELGEIRLVQVEYPQDWLAEPIEQTGQKQAAWRTDPKQSGAGGSTGDIGTHAYNLGCFVSGLDARGNLRRCAYIRCRAAQLDDNAHVMLRFKGGAKGMLWCSQVAHRPRKRPQGPCLWHQGRHRMGAGRSELSLVHAAWPAQAADHPRRRWVQCRCRPRAPAFHRVIRKAISKALPRSMPKRRAPSSPVARARRSIRPSSIRRVEDGVKGVVFVDRLHRVVQAQRRLGQGSDNPPLAEPACLSRSCTVPDSTVSCTVASAC